MRNGQSQLSINFDSLVRTQVAGQRLPRPGCETSTYSSSEPAPAGVGCELLYFVLRTPDGAGFAISTQSKIPKPVLVELALRAASTAP
uniref:Uncharacterized protein n=1 Tax=Romanomermis culicivorax TaxID=13658 RepID=A0A915HHA3_ROMCU